MKHIGKSLAVILAAVVLLLATACASSFEYDKDMADGRAREVIDVINTQDYDAIVGLFREDLQPLTTPAQFEAAWEPYLGGAGAFVEIKSIQSAGQTDDDGQQYIVTAVRCDYENASYTYTIVFDTDFNVTGLYLK